MIPLSPHPIAKIFPPMTQDEYQALKTDIEENGLRQPIILYENQVLDGLNRYRACRELDIEPDTREYDGFNPLAFVISQNLHRRHLTESQRAMIAAEIATMKRGSQPGNTKASKDDDKKTNVENPTFVSEMSQGEAAIQLNVSRDTVNKAAKVVKEAQPEVVEAVREGRIKVSDAAQILEAKPEDQRKAVEDVEKGVTNTVLASVNRQDKERRKKEPRPLPTDQYRVVVLDPPWPMQKLELEARPNQVAFDYPTMSLEQIADLEVPQLLAEDAWVFIWTTQRFLPDAFGLLGRWQLRYRFTMVWNKSGQHFSGYPVVGLPRYNCEFLAVGSKGKPDFLTTKGFGTVFEGENKGHSIKPIEFYETLERVTEGPRLDMFSRRDIAGFTPWGDRPDGPEVPDGSPAV